MFPERTSWMRVRMPVENRRGIISATTPGRKEMAARTIRTNHVEPSSVGKASVTTEEKKRLRAEQTEERVPWMKQE